MANPKIQLRHDTKENWTQQNPLLLVGEVAVETDTGRTKTGDGTTLYNNLPYDLQGELDKKEDKLTPVTPIVIEDKAIAPTSRWNVDIANNIITPEGTSSTFPLYHTWETTPYPTNTNDNCRSFKYYTNRDYFWDEVNNKPIAYISIPIEQSNDTYFNTISFQHFIGGNGFKCCLPALLGYWEGDKFITTILMTDTIVGSSSSYPTTSWVYGNPNGIEFTPTDTSSSVEKAFVPNNATFCIEESGGFRWGAASNDFGAVPNQMAFLQIGVLNNEKGYLGLQLFSTETSSQAYVRCACTFENSNSDFVAAIRKVTHILYVSNEAINWSTSLFGSYKGVQRLAWTKNNNNPEAWGNYQRLNYPNSFDLSKLENYHNISINYDTETLGLQDGKLTVINGDPGGTIATQINGLQTQVSQNSNAISANTENISNLSTGKSNIEADNFSASGKDYLSKIGMPSNRGTQLTIGATGATYIAPANGYFRALGTFNAAKPTQVTLENHTSQICASSFNNAGWSLYAWLPARKGDAVVYYYNFVDMNPTLHGLYFVYAEGAE